MEKKKMWGIGAIVLVLLLVVGGVLYFCLKDSKKKNKDDINSGNIKSVVKKYTDKYIVRAVFEPTAYNLEGHEKTGEYTFTINGASHTFALYNTPNNGGEILLLDDKTYLYDSNDAKTNMFGNDGSYNIYDIKEESKIIKDEDGTEYYLASVSSGDGRYGYYLINSNAEIFASYTWCDSFTKGDTSYNNEIGDNKFTIYLRVENSKTDALKVVGTLKGGTVQFGDGELIKDGKWKGCSF